MAIGGMGKDQLYINQRSFLIMIHPGKAQKAQEGVSIQKLKDYKTLILMLLDEITFVIVPDYIFVDL
jgi:hypothetical protein